MIEFLKVIDEEPFLLFKNYYDKAIINNQKSIHAISISSYSKKNQEVYSRFVNLKFVDGDRFIFFSNYKSPKAIQFSSHNQISSLIYWDKINVQIRIMANIKKTDKDFNKEYFKHRNINKNALAIASEQSMPIKSFDDFKKNYENTFKNVNLKQCPDYWGGFAFIPYSFEFWEGDKNRLNKRVKYEKNLNNWNKFYLSP